MHSGLMPSRTLVGSLRGCPQRSHEPPGAVPAGGAVAEPVDCRVDAYTRCSSSNGVQASFSIATRLGSIRNCSDKTL